MPRRTLFPVVCLAIVLTAAAMPFGASQDPLPVSRATKEVEPIQLVVPKYVDIMGESHSLYENGGDPRVKMLGSDLVLYESLPDTFEPRNVWVWTLGVPTVYLSASNETTPEVVTLQGFIPTPDQVDALAGIAQIDWVSEIRPFVSVVASSRGQVDSIAALPFVYMIEIPSTDVATPTAAYSVSNVRSWERADWARDSRNLWDGSGNGAMPNSVKFHVIDTGYDWLDNPFNVNYAGTRINAHGHDWSSHNNGIAGSEDNSHGTGVTNVIDILNYQGGSYYVHQVATLDDVRQALEDIQINHFSADVVNIGVVRVEGDLICEDDWDDILQDLVLNRGTYITSPVGNPDPSVRVHYPAQSTFVTGVGGIWDNWNVPTNALYGWVSLSSTWCPLQWNYHQARDGATSIFKPDVYGIYCIESRPTKGENFCGTSASSPQVASGVGNFAARYYLLGGSWIPFKQWKASGSCWEGVYRLTWASAAPNGANVLPSASSERGDVAAHNIYFSNPWTC